MNEAVRIIIFYILSFSLGFLWAFSELLSRYKVGKLILRSKNAWIYLLINGMASVIVYYLIPQLNITFGVFTSTEWGKVLLAGFVGHVYSAKFIFQLS